MDNSFFDSLRQTSTPVESNFALMKSKFGKLRFTAIIRSIQVSDGKITYLLEDFTGSSVNGHYLLKDGDDAEKLASDKMINGYATVEGFLGGAGNIFSIDDLTPVTDPGDISKHDYEVQTAREEAQEPIGLNKNGDLLGIPILHLVFQEIQKNCAGNDVTFEGVSRLALQKKFKHIHPKELAAILDSLTSDGHIYSTTDQDHFLVTE